MIARYQTLVQRIQLEFVPRFAPGAKLIYLKGAKNVAPVVDNSIVKRFGFSLENQSI